RGVSRLHEETSESIISTVLIRFGALPPKRGLLEQNYLFEIHALFVMRPDRPPDVAVPQNSTVKVALGRLNCVIDRKSGIYFLLRIGSKNIPTGALDGCALCGCQGGDYGKIEVRLCRLRRKVAPNERRDGPGRSASHRKTEN